MLTHIGTTIIAYLPNLLAAAIVAIIAWIVADKIYKAILKTNPNGQGLAKGIKYLIYVIAAFMIVSQLHIATNIVHILFFALVIGVAAAFAIAFGVGGRGWAAKKLEEFDSAVKEQRERRAERKAATSSAGSSDESAKGSFFGSMFNKDTDKDVKNGASSSVNEAKEAAETEAKEAVDAAYSDASDAAEGYADRSAEDAVKEASDDMAKRTQNAADKAHEEVKEAAKEAVKEDSDDAEARKSRIKFRKNK